MCNLLNKEQTTCDIVSGGSSDSSEASFICNGGGLIPLYKASDLQPVTVAELPAGTSIDVVVKTESQIPQGIVLGL